MTDPTHPDADPTADEPALDDDLTALLAGETVWDDADPADEDAIVAAITAEVAAGVVPSATTDHGSDADPQPGQTRGVVRWIGPAAAGIAAAAAVLIGVVVLQPDDGAGDGELVALSAPDEAGAAAEATIVDTPRGTRIDLDPAELPPAPDGTYYELTLANATETVSAGTFHLRDGSGEIALWAGVGRDTHPELTVTLESLDDSGPSDGEIVLRTAAAGP